MAPKSLERSSTIDLGRGEAQTRYVLSSSTVASKSSRRDSFPEAPMSDTHTVPLLSSLTLEEACVSFSHGKHAEEPKMQNSSPSVQLELARIVRPAARLPGGGKQPRSLVHVDWAVVVAGSEAM